MGSWRDGASPEAQNDLDTLLDLTLPFAQQQLVDHGEFIPFAAAVSTAGEARLVMAAPTSSDEPPPSAEVIDMTVSGLRGQRDRIRATAIAANVGTAEMGDAIAIDLEHADGHAITVLQPYAIEPGDNSISFRDLLAQPGPSRIWMGG